eukprot:2577719-Ditylum_brightwellii.AAC.1
MENIIGRSDVRSGLSRLKLELQRIVDFSGKVEDRQKLKKCTQCAFNGSGVVFSKLSVATSGGTAYHLVKQHKKDKDLYAAWQSLIEWFDVDVLKAKTADTIRARLESYKLGNGTTTS